MDIRVLDDVMIAAEDFYWIIGITIHRVVEQTVLRLSVKYAEKRIGINERRLDNG